MTQGGATLEARILAPGDARFVVVSANPPKPQRQQPKVRNLTVRLPSKTCDTRIVVLMSPGGGATPPRRDAACGVEVKNPDCVKQLC